MRNTIAKYEALSQRERLLIVASVVVAIYLLASSLIWSPLNQRQDSLNADIGRLNTDITRLSSELAVYTRAASVDPDQGKKQQVQTLQQQVDSLDQSLSQLSVGLIPAHELPMLLQEVLKKTARLQLEKLTTLPVTELSLQGEVLSLQGEVLSLEGEVLSLQEEAPPISERKKHTNNTDGSVAASQTESMLETAGVFKHSVSLSLRGGYVDIQHYLQALEALPWRLYWDSLSYRVSDYPNAEVSLQVYTLSTEMGVFGETLNE